MPRAAGNDTHYEFWLNASKSMPSIRLPSVTTILHSVFGANQYVVDWAANNFKNADEMRAYRDERSEQGTAAHEFVERWVAEPVIEPKTGYDEAFLRFVREHQPVFSLSESVVFSIRGGYAGTLDLGLLESGGRTRIVDVKTKKKTIYKAYDSELIQCRAYGEAAYEMGLISEREPETGILILKDNGRYTYDTRSVPLSTWHRTLDMYHELKAVPK